MGGHGNKREDCFFKAVPVAASTPSQRVSRKPVQLFYIEVA